MRSDTILPPSAGSIRMTTPPALSSTTCGDHPRAAGRAGSAAQDRLSVCASCELDERESRWRHLLGIDGIDQIQRPTDLIGAAEKVFPRRCNAVDRDEP